MSKQKKRSRHLAETNWPTRDEAAHHVPRESRRGQNVASRRTYESRRVAATARSMESLLAKATRHYTRSAALSANDAREREIATHTANVCAARDAAAADYARRNA